MYTVTHTLIGVWLCLWVVDQHSCTWAMWQSGWCVSCGWVRLSFGQCESSFLVNHRGGPVCSSPNHVPHRPLRSWLVVLHSDSPPFDGFHHQLGGCHFSLLVRPRCGDAACVMLPVFCPLSPLALTSGVVSTAPCNVPTLTHFVTVD
jgi:hypothetical protein